MSRSVFVGFKGNGFWAYDVVSATYLRATSTVLWNEIEKWETWPIRRGHDSIPSEPVARFGEALIALLEGKLAQPPAGHWWFYTLADEVDTLKRPAM